MNAPFSSLITLKSYDFLKAPLGERANQNIACNPFRMFWLTLFLIVRGMGRGQTQVNAELLQTLERRVVLRPLLGRVELGRAKPLSIDDNFHLPVILTFALQVLLKGSVKWFKTCMLGQK